MGRRRATAILIAAAILAAGPLTGDALAGPPDQADGFEVLDGHVFVVIGLSLRNPAADTPLHEPLYNSSGIALESSPGDPVTWGEWLSAGGTSRAATIGGPNGARTDVRVDLEGLVHNGAYSVFWFTVEPDSSQALCPGVERRLPLDAFKADPLAPDRNSFLAGAAGAASFHGRIDGDLLAATQFWVQLVYHADGQTYYPFPNAGEYITQGPNCRSSFGQDAMVHLSIGQKVLT